MVIIVGFPIEQLQEDRFEPWGIVPEFDHRAASGGNRRTNRPTSVGTIEFEAKIAIRSNLRRNVDFRDAIDGGRQSRR